VPVAGGLPKAAVSVLALAGKNLGARLRYAATHGRGVYRIKIG
jgi:hypothetical protein